MDADIAKCFDRINHEALLEKLNTFPTLRRQIKAWQPIWRQKNDGCLHNRSPMLPTDKLKTRSPTAASSRRATARERRLPSFFQALPRLKSGVMDNKELFPTSKGTPQGGVISPLLANIALHGLENRIKQAFPHRKVYNNGKRKHISSPDFIRYADDFVVLHEDQNIVQECQQIVSEWLISMGLELKPSKTSLTHTFHKYEGKVGFDFLGHTIRQYKVGNYRADKNNQRKSLEFITLITPSS